jgi:hypothetical protein
MNSLIGSMGRLLPAGPVIIGGLAVMSRVGGEHRPTLDIDSAFDNESDIPTTTLLVAGGIARDEAPIQRVSIDDALVDIIDTFPIVVGDLPDGPGDRLFVCAHRYAYETATPVTFVGDSARTTVMVATVEGLLAMKAHALCFGSAGRRATKRSSDLYDVIRLTTAGDDDLLVTAPWELRAQVRDALARDLADLQASAAVLAGSPVKAISDVTVDLLELVTATLLERLGE